MSWQRFHRRTAAVRFVLERFGNAPEHLPHPREHAELSPVFTDDHDMLGALQHKWINQLMGRLERRLSESADHTAERLEATRLAWEETATANPELRRILDHHLPTAHGEALRALRAEQRLLAVSSGLVDHDGAPSETDRTGEALLRLLRGTREQHEPVTV
ncbi:hypothetical protein [Actinopolyspora mortivallis]|uniref:hypothetical protein n=1 Tax=Actinopolyspora mortivallis TaxID=33906 RepID=UPI00035F282C|nr:hypothetical protein [Actinopolyspora mortivallis]